MTNIKKSIAISVLLLFCGMIMLTGCGGSGYTRISGVYVLSESGTSYLVYSPEEDSETLVKLLPVDETVDFEGIVTGDLMEVKIVLIEENDGESITEVFDWQRKAESYSKISDTVLERIKELENTKK